MTPEFVYVLGAGILLLALGLAVFSEKTRNRSKDGLTEAATREQYRHPERYERTQKQFEDAAKD